MRSNEKELPEGEVDGADLVDPDTEVMPPDEESDVLDNLLHRIGRHDKHESVWISCRSAEEDEYIDKQDLCLVMDDLQFGCDLRL